MTNPPTNRPIVRWIPLLAIGAVLALSIAALGNLVGTPPVAPRPAPFDALSVEEQERAIALALGDPAVDSALSARFEVIGASLRTDKADMLQADPPRLADVQLYDYERDVVVWLVVDLDLGFVRAELPVPAGYAPPLTAGEMLRAGALARAHPDVQARLADHPDAVEIGHLWTDGGEPCDSHRCLTVSFYEEDGAWGFGFLAIVDLSDEVVLEVRDSHSNPGQGGA